MQNSHKEFRGPIPWISNGVPTSEARRSSGDDSGTTCEADLGRQTQRGAGAGGTGRGRVWGQTKLVNDFLYAAQFSF